MPKERWKDVFNYRDGHTVKWKRCGINFFNELAALIGLAEKNIHLQIYLIDPDETGNLMLDALKAASKRGVEVNLVVDDYGAGRLKPTDEAALEAAGVVFKRFEPFISSGRYYLGRRMHHKIVVIDERIAVVGGMNFANRYRGTEQQHPWLDYAVVVTGPVCKDLTQVCKKILERQFTPTVPKWPRIFPRGNSIDTSGVWVRTRKNDWLRSRAEITLSYNKAARLSTDSITIVGGYFLPGRRYRSILANASKRGVKIKIIMTHFSDVPVVKYASDYLYGWLIRNNIQIFESQHSMVHGKVAIVDEKWATVGSYNQNHLSAYLSIELNLDIVNHDFAKSFNAHLLEVIDKECIEITSEVFIRNSSVLSKLRRWFSYQLVRVSLRILFVVNRIFVVND